MTARSQWASTRPRAHRNEISVKQYWNVTSSYWVKNAMCGYAFWDAEGAPPHMNIYVLNSSVNSHVRFKIFAIAYWSFMLCRSIFPSFSKQTLSANLFLCMCPLIQFDVWTPFVIIHYRITVHDLKIQLIWHKPMLLHLLHKISVQPRRWTWIAII